MKLERFEIPTPRAGEWVYPTIVAHVEEEAVNPGVFISFVRGPASVRYRFYGDEGDLPSYPDGYTLYRSGRQPRCATVAPSGFQLMFPEPGTYTLFVAVGIVVAETRDFMPTDYKYIDVEVQQPAAMPAAPLSLTDIAIVAGSIAGGAALGYAVRRPELGAAVGSALAGGYIAYRLLKPTR